MNKNYFIWGGVAIAFVVLIVVSIFMPTHKKSSVFVASLSNQTGKAPNLIVEQSSQKESKKPAPAKKKEPKKTAPEKISDQPKIAPVVAPPAITSVTSPTSSVLKVPMPHSPPVPPPPPPPPTPPPPPPPPPVNYTLLLVKHGTGSGSMTGPSLECDASCTGKSQDYVSGTPVELTAVPANDSQFTGWAGVCSGTGTCQVVMDAAKTVEATFNVNIPSAPPHVLIAEIMVRSEESNSDSFVVLYNAGGSDADLTGWKVTKKSSTGSESDIVVASRLSAKIIPAGHYFLLANDTGYTGTVVPDVVWAHSHTLAMSNNALILYDATGTPADTVAWENIPAGKSYARTSWNTSTFVIQDMPTPKNSSTPP